MVKIKIVEDMEEELEKDGKRLKKIWEGKYFKPDKERILTMTPKTFASVFSPQRLKLLKTIKKNKLKSIQDLVTQLKRPYEAVHRDIKYLEGLGLINIKLKDHNRIPTLQEPIRIPVLV